ncbi:response regulator [Microbulbifer harenosus]|uniref:response regulator n=1 Tax=Microbulbifer harenosus TaxID=2576840 RepID=UPI003CCC8671
MIKVLVVDDHDLVRMGISRMLSDVEDIEVVGEAKSGEEAIAFVRESEVDVILMDVRMPGMGGLEATRKLIPRFPQAKVVAVSALDDDLFPSRLIQAGAPGLRYQGGGSGRNGPRYPRGNGGRNVHQQFHGYPPGTAQCVRRDIAI